MINILILIAAIFFNVFAQLSIKIGAYNKPMSDVTEITRVVFSPFIVIAIFFYGLSFFLTVKVFSCFPVSRASPIMAGATFVMVAIAGNLFFGEALTFNNWLGIFVIVIGVWLLMK